MNAAILFGVLSALMYGTTDFIARFANKSSGVVRTMLWGQGLLAVLLTIVLVAGGYRLHATCLQWGILVVSNLVVMASTASLYYGLAHGRIAVVSPVTACYGAVSALLACLTGETLSLVAAGGLALAVLGAILSAVPAKGEDAPKGPSGWLPATGAAIGYGIGFWLQGHYAIPAFGAFPVIWAYYSGGFVILLVVARIRRQPLMLARRRDIGLITMSALLAAGGYLALAFGQATGEVAVTTALSAAANAITVILAFVFVREKVTPAGWIGVACVVAGIAILHLAG